MLLIPSHSDRPELPHSARQPDAPERATSAVRKEFLHLSFDDSVFLTGCERRGAMEFALTARWPGFIRAAESGGVRHEPLVVAQTIRQAGLLIAHAEFETPLNHAMLLRTFGFRLDASFQPPEGVPVEVVLHASGAEQDRRGARLTGLRLQMELTTPEGMRIGSGATDFEWIAPAVYRRLRGNHVEAVRDQPPLPAPVAPERVGRHDPAEVALSPTERARRWQLRCDFSNRLLYDHPVDHAPGLVLIEAAHQAARLTAPASFVPRTVRTAFDQYVEFDAPCWIEAETFGGEAGGDGFRVMVRGYQDDRQVFRSTLT
ncbi:ScbA/BarX family gamma-butyrolactone biosynthesis protein [Streptomyces sp. NPDC059080]|uniref:ScbA/BarX family gamma-butyrolactone biosynthesis protein n=1 Tax=Streptomyces sp. NPDC059080 TaxID=3346718 RepID=UPI00369AF916